MILKNVSKRTLALFLAAIMVFLLLPLSPMNPIRSRAESSTIDLVDGLGVTYEISEAKDGSVEANTSGGLTIKASSKTVTTGSGCNSSTETTPTEITVTLKNTQETQVLLSFTSPDFAPAGGTVTITPVGISGSDYSAMLQPGEAVVIKVTSGMQEGNSIELVLRDITAGNPNESYNVTVDYDGSFGGVKVKGEAISGKQSFVDVSATDGIALLATPNSSSVVFLGWIDASTNVILSTETNYVFKPKQDTSVTALFAKADGTDVPKFGVGTRSNQQGSGLAIYYTVSVDSIFDNLNDAAAAAEKSASAKYIILLTGGRLPTGNYEIPAGVTLLIPHDASNTCYGDDPYTVEMPGSRDLAAIPSAYRTLTIADGVTITVNGALELAAQHYASHGGSDYGGRPVDKYGHIDMQGSSKIVLEDGASLYAWGYITGSTYAQVIAESGSTIHEKMQVSDYRGGSRTTVVTKDGHFPFSQYYIQNVEVKETIKSGSSLVCHASIYASSMQEQQINFMGTGTGNEHPMFSIGSNSKATKYYDAINDRLIVDVEGDFSFNSISLMGEDTADFVLPLQQNLTINLNDGTVAKINQDIMLQPGCIISINEGAKLEIASGKKLYLMDADQWGNFCGAASVPVVPITFVPTKGAAPGIRNSNNIKDANLNIRGTLIVSGAIYASASHAIVSGEGGAGVIEFRAAASASSQIKLATTSTSGTLSGYTADWTTVAMTPIVLTNTDGSTVDTKGTAAGTNYYFHCDIWQTGKEVIENEVAETCTVNGSYDIVLRCTKCDEEFGRTTITVKAPGHTAGTAVVENNVAPTCTTAGSYDSVVYCTVCNAEISRTPVTVDALGHTPGEAVIENNIAPGCTTAGSYDSVIYCSTCGEELSRETVTVEATGHHFEHGVCTACGHMLGDLTGDGEITIVDVTRLNAYRLGEIELTEEELAAADINGDGKITMLDAARLNAYFKGVIDEL